ncbi:GNAT family N-acetyltransferase [Frateuria defendens]|uniref:GNAT family N-acetyltransferase n=1 Tax=Frateuria defendens TaxID=2219559 RepID=UPI00066FE873|nr:GNAT family N-acetyltransferase [Frateuria defendens]
MPAPPRVHVAPVEAGTREAVIGLRVQPPQQDFVGPAATALADAEHCPGSEPMAILRDGVPIGFYRIERNAAVIAGRDLGPGAFGLRSFFIDAAWQGRGLGTLALEAALADLCRRHAGARLLALTVNCRNHAALALYRGGGFEDSGELYHGGRSGPQHLLLRRLPG